MSRAAEMQTWAADRLPVVLPGDVDQVVDVLLDSGACGRAWMAYRMATALVVVRDHGVNAALTLVPSSTLYRWMRYVRDRDVPA